MGKSFQKRVSTGQATNFSIQNGQIVPRPKGTPATPSPATVQQPITSPKVDDVKAPIVQDPLTTPDQAAEIGTEGSMMGVAPTTSRPAGLTPTMSPTPLVGGVGNVPAPVQVASGTKAPATAASANVNQTTQTANTGAVASATNPAQAAAARANQMVANNASQFSMPSMQGITFGGT